MSTYSIKTFNSVNTIDHKYWKELDCTSNVYFTPEFLLAYERSNTNVGFKYLVATDERNHAVGLGIIQIIEIGIETILENIKISKRLKGIIDYFLCNNSLKITFIHIEWSRRGTRFSYFICYSW